jgi:parvulin-like peptidyl-prolyl isomerase
MAKENQENEPKIITKKHTARLERERKQRKVLLIGIISLLAVIVLLIVYGVLNSTVLQAGKTVAKINNEKITVEQFQKRVRYERLTQTQMFLNYQLSQLASYFQPQLLQVQNELDDYLTFGEGILDKMVTEAVIAQQAKEMGITVSEEEIDLEIQEQFGYFANGTPTPAPTEEYKPTSTYSPTQLALVAETAIVIEEPAATPEATAAVVEATVDPAVVLETPTATVELPTLTPTVEPTATTIPPTPTEYTEAGFENLYATVVANLEAQTAFGSVEFREYVRNTLYSRKLFELITKDVLAEQDMVWARHILVATEEEANAVIDRLEAGEGFSVLAAELSLDTSNSLFGGDLGWIAKGQMVEEFESAIWPMEVSAISAPVKTSFGYHIIQVLGHEVREMNADELSTTKSTAFSKFVDDAQLASSIKKLPVWASVVPLEPAIPSEYRIVQ